MTRFLIRRLLSAIPVLFVVSLVTFLILWLVPGDITAEIGGPDATAADLAAIRDRLGLDQPLWERALSWYGHVLQGDLGHSYLLEPLGRRRGAGTPAGHAVAGRAGAGDGNGDRHAARASSRRCATTPGPTRAR